MEAGPVTGRRRRWLLGAAVLLGLVLPLFLVLHAHRVNGSNGLPLDDSWIHLTYARTLHEHGWFAYFPGAERTQGSTAPLYTLLLAATFGVIQDEKILSYALGLLFHAGFLAMTALWARGRLGEPIWAALVVLAVGLDDRIGLLAVSGMETSLFLFLLAAAFAARAARRHVTAGVAAGLLVWVRPDGLILAGVLAGDLALERWLAFRSPESSPQVGAVTDSGGGFAARGRAGAARGEAVAARGRAGAAVLRRDPLPRLALPVLLLAAGYFAFNLAVGGSLLPNTFAAKTAYYRINPRIGFLTREVGPLFWSGPRLVLLPFALYAIGREVTRALRGRAGILRPEAVWCLALPLAYLALLPYSHRFERYLVPVIPPLAILSFSGLRSAATGLSRGAFRWQSRPATAVVVLLLAALAFGLRGAGKASAEYTDLCAYHRARHEQTGRWIDGHTPRDAVIAAHDVGAIAFYGRRRVVDLAGVLLPEVVAHLNRPDYTRYVVDLLTRERVTHLAVLRNWLDVANCEPLFVADPRPEIMVVCAWEPGRTHLVSQEVIEMSRAAAEMSRRREYDSAVAVMQRAVEADPENSRAWYLLGFIQEGRNRPGEAEAAYRRALALYPEFPEVTLRLAALFARYGRVDDARSVLRPLLARNPNYPGAAELAGRLGGGS